MFLFKFLISHPKNLETFMAWSSAQDVGLKEALFMTDCWANVMGQGTEHSFHQHNRSTISSLHENWCDLEVFGG